MIIFTTGCGANSSKTSINHSSCINSYNSCISSQFVCYLLPVKLNQVKNHPSVQQLSPRPVSALVYLWGRRLGVGTRTRAARLQFPRGGKPAHPRRLPPGCGSRSDSGPGDDSAPDSPRPGGATPRPRRARTATDSTPVERKEKYKKESNIITSLY